MVYVLVFILQTSRGLREVRLLVPAHAASKWQEKNALSLMLFIKEFRHSVVFCLHH